MSCTSPRPALLLSFNDGSSQILFREFPGQTITGIIDELHHDYHFADVVEVNPIKIPCGKCPDCKMTKAREWAVRIMHESKAHRQNCFITLTYADTYLPSDRLLCKSDIQKFIKRLRSRHPDRTIRYYYVGEYGGKTHRPHYHAVIFGYDFSDDRRLLFISNGKPLYRSAELESLWPFGISSIGALSFESAGYVARYILKNDGTANKGFSHMSLKPGIGACHFDAYKNDIYNSDKVFCQKHGKTFEIRVPRYYDKLLEREDPKKFEEVKSKRRSKYLELNPNNMFQELDLSDNYDDLKRKREVHKERRSLLHRKYEEQF